MRQESQKLQPVGYQDLLERFEIDPLPHFRASYVTFGSLLGTKPKGEQEIHTYPKTSRPEPSVTGHLEFALKYDGLNLGILKAVFERCDPGQLSAWIRSKPTGKYTRRAWYLFEWLTGRQLNVPDLKRGTYVEVLDSRRYFTATPRRSTRHRVRDNLLGSPRFCPVVRRSERLRAHMGKDLAERTRGILAGYSPQLIQRAAQFLYLKETKSSFEIEREQPSRRRLLRFVELLRSAASRTASRAAPSSATSATLDKQAFIELQNAIVEPRYAEDDYRKQQNYVGQILRGYRERVDYVCPKANDVQELMEGLLECNRRLAESDLDPVVQAAPFSFGFVFIHPFEDGNGRLHRFLIHHVLARTGFTPKGMILPVSARMLAEPSEYDACLEFFSRPVMQRIKYDLDPRGAMSVHGDTADLYRYPDATAMAEYLYDVLEKTITRDLKGELDFLTRFDQAWRGLQEIVDIPDRKMELFIRLCTGNRGKLSATRRRSQFAELTAGEIAAMEMIVAETLALDD